MSEDFAVSCQQDAHDADPEPAGEWLDEATLIDRALDMRTSAVARMQAAIARPTGADLMRQAVAQEVAELAHLDHARMRDAVLALRAETEFGSPSWYDAYRCLMDVADRIAGAAS